MEQAIRDYAGFHYADPREVKGDRVDFDDYEDLDTLIEGLIDFRQRTQGMKIVPIVRDSDYSGDTIGFEARRLETPEEVSKRVNGYRQYVLERAVQRRAAYERMKREFGDN